MKMTSVKKVPATKTIGVVMIVIMLFALTALVFGCVPSTETGAKGNSPEAPANDPYAVSFTWETNADCSVCHQKEHNSFADATTKAGVHSTLPCSTCHTDSALSTVHKEVTSASKTPIRLRSTKVEQATCLNCHENLESLAQKSAGTTVLTDAKGTVVNPHALPETSDHAIISCVSCHKMHTAEAVEKTAQDLCISCHHEKVFTCYTCHD